MATRLELLEREINKGISIDEKGGGVIQNWSPNNVRRLAIGVDGVIVEYFLTGGKYKRNQEFIPFKTELYEDTRSLEAYIQTGDAKHKVLSILTALVKGRICSSIEEIYFCTPGYPQRLLQLDLDVKALAKNEDNAANRFVRLRHISTIDVPVKQVGVWFGEARKGTMLALDVIKKHQAPVKTVVSMHEEDWWSGTSLRPRYYPLDGLKLSEYFSKVEQSMAIKQQESKNEQSKHERNLSSLTKRAQVIKTLGFDILRILEQGTQIQSEAGIIDRSEYARHLIQENVLRKVYKTFKDRDTLYKDMRSIDYQGVLNLAREEDVFGADHDRILEVMDLITVNIFSYDELYKQESRILSVSDSVPLLVQHLKTILQLLVYNVYYTAVSYANRMNTKYIPKYSATLVEAGAVGVTFTRNVTEFCNKYTTDEVARNVFDTCNWQEVKEADYVYRVMVDNALKLLQALKGVAA